MERGLLGGSGGVDGVVVLTNGGEGVRRLVDRLASTLNGVVPVFVVDAETAVAASQSSGPEEFAARQSAPQPSGGIHHLAVDLDNLRPGLAEYADTLRRNGVLRPLMVVSSPIWFPFVEMAYSRLCIYYLDAIRSDGVPDFEPVPAAGAARWLSRLLERYADGCVVPDDEGAEEYLRRAWPLVRNVCRADELFSSGLGSLDAWLRTVASNPSRYPRKLEMLMLCAPNSLQINTVHEYVESFSLYSRHHVKIVGSPHVRAPRRVKIEGADIDYNSFDVLILHHTSRICVEGYLDPGVERAIERFAGYKVLFIQDEYNATEVARRWIERMGIHLVFTVVPQPHIGKVYPPERFPSTEFRQVLTGYVPVALESGVETRPMKERPHHIVYRGNVTPFYYGELGREKSEIGVRMKAICQERGIREDIEWLPEKKINGVDWFAFLQSGRATLGTESGSNVFDIDGSLKTQVQEFLAVNPDASFEEVQRKFLAGHENALGFEMNQVSPKIFEFIAARTALILFRGSYSGILQEDVHYIPLNKDFSNVGLVLERLEDLDYLQAMTDRAFTDIIASKKYSYRSFVNSIDDILEERVKGAAQWYLGDPQHLMLDHALSFREQLETAAGDSFFKRDNLALELLVQRTASRQSLQVANDKYVAARDRAAMYRDKLLALQERHDALQNAVPFKRTLNALRKGYRTLRRKLPSA